MGRELVLVNQRTHKNFDMKLVERLKRMYELCDDAFSKGTFIHEWRYNVNRLVWLLVQPQCRKQPLKKLGHQLRATKWQQSNITSQRKSILQCVLSAALIVSLVSKGKICCMCNIPSWATSVMLLLQRLWKTVLSIQQKHVSWATLLLSVLKCTTVMISYDYMKYYDDNFNMTTWYSFCCPKSQKFPTSYFPQDSYNN